MLATMKSDSRTETRTWLPVLLGAVAVAVGLIAFWTLGVTATDEAPGPEGVAPTSEVHEAAAEPTGEAPDLAPSDGGASAQTGAAEIKLEPRLFTDYGFRVGLDASWTVETGAAGLRVIVPEGRFFVLRTPAPTKIGTTAQPPGNQQAVSTRRVAGTDVLCTVDADAPEAVRALAEEVCKTVTDQGGIGLLTSFECEADADIDLATTVVAVEGVREEIIECFTAAHRAEVEMPVGQASVAVEPSPEGVPLLILVGGDVPTERSFRWLKGCMTHLFRHVKYTKQGDGAGLLRCEFQWSIE